MLSELLPMVRFNENLSEGYRVERCEGVLDWSRVVALERVHKHDDHTTVLLDSDQRITLRLTFDNVRNQWREAKGQPIAVQDARLQVPPDLECCRPGCSRLATRYTRMAGLRADLGPFCDECEPGGK